MQPAGRYVFIGGRDRGLHWLHRALERRRLPVAVYCLQEDQHETEKYSLEIARFCEQHAVSCQLRRRLREQDESDLVALAPDLAVVMGWRTLVSERVLSAPRHGAVGVHESLLPAYRGFAPVNWAVINGESETGVSLFYLTSTGVDNGDIVAQARISIGDDETAYDVYRRTSRSSVELLDAHLDALLKGVAPRTPQDEQAATYTCARNPEDGIVDWSRGTRVIHNLVRGLAHPYPGALSYCAGKPYRIWSGEELRPSQRYVGRIPGRIIASAPGRGVDVLTGDGIYRVHTAGEVGQPPVPAETLFRSVRMSLGDRHPA